MKQVNQQSGVSVGVFSEKGSPDRVLLSITSPKNNVTLKPKFARMVAIQLIMIADFLETTTQG